MCICVCIKTIDAVLLCGGGWYNVGFFLCICIWIVCDVMLGNVGLEVKKRENARLLRLPLKYVCLFEFRFIQFVNVVYFICLYFVFAGARAGFLYILCYIYCWKRRICFYICASLWDERKKNRMSSLFDKMAFSSKDEVRTFGEL